jgi:hypothetical protein
MDHYVVFTVSLISLMRQGSKLLIFYRGLLVLANSNTADYFPARLLAS